MRYCGNNLTITKSVWTNAADGQPENGENMMLLRTLSGDEEIKKT